MTIDNHGHEYEFEPQFGLPERLPADERIVWQASPDVATLARDAFHIRKLAVYFAVLWVARAAPEVTSGAGVLEVLWSLRWLAPLTVLGLGIAWILAWMTARTTVYTLTNKRIVMRLGIVLTVTFNLPLVKISSASVRRMSDGLGDITLALSGDDRIAWVHLWPSVRPWRISRPEPMVRSIANVDARAAQLSEVWSSATGMAANAARQPQANPGMSQVLRASLT
jgi:hypothetical protein